MIKSFEPMPFDGDISLPTYVTGVDAYKLIGTAPGGYKITLGELEVGNSVSAGNPLTHALFRSYTDRGEQMKVVRVRIAGADRELDAAMNAMRLAGFELLPALPNACESILYSLGAWMQLSNPELVDVSVVSQTCH